MNLFDPYSELFLNKITKRMKKETLEKDPYHYSSTTTVIIPIENKVNEDDKYFSTYKEIVSVLTKLTKANIKFPIQFNVNGIIVNIEIIDKSTRIKASCDGNTLLFTGDHYNASASVFLKLAPKIMDYLSNLLKSKRLNDVDDIDEVNDLFISKLNTPS